MLIYGKVEGRPFTLQYLNLPIYPFFAIIGTEERRCYLMYQDQEITLRDLSAVRSDEFMFDGGADFDAMMNEIQQMKDDAVKFGDDKLLTELYGDDPETEPL